MSRVVHFHGTEPIIHEPTGVLLQPGPNEIASDEHAAELLESGYASEHPVGEVEAVADATGDTAPVTAGTEAPAPTGEDPAAVTTPDATSEGGDATGDNQE